MVILNAARENLKSGEVIKNMPTLYFDHAEIGGRVHLGEGFLARGAVRLQSTKIAGDLICQGGSFIGAPLQER